MFNDLILLILTAIVFAILFGQWMSGELEK